MRVLRYLADGIFWLTQVKNILNLFRSINDDRKKDADEKKKNE